MNEETPESTPLADVLSHPFRSLQGLLEFAMAWLFTRDWKTVLGFSPVLLLVLTLTGLMIYGWAQDESQLASRYLTWVDEELKNANKADETAPQAQTALMKLERITPDSEMLLRRILQLQNSDQRSRYLVAIQIGSYGRRGQARHIMRQLAPERQKGFAPAHAWLAVDRILQGPIRDNATKQSLMNDLENAVTWNGTGTQLREILASLLENEGRVGDAIKVLKETTASDANAWVPLIAVSLRNGRKQPADEAKLNAKRIFTDRIANQSATATDYVNSAWVWVLDENPDQAIEQLDAGLKQFPDDRTLLRALSECYRIKFMASYRESAEGIDCDVALLDEALKADPTNLAVSEEVARLLARGGSASPTLREALNQQLANGKATTMTHLMLATRALKESKLEKAIPHLEVALRNAPNAPVVLNNLAVALCRVSPENAGRSRELIDRALKISGPNAEMLDSQGEIRMASGDYVGAVESFESAVGLDGKRIATRRRLMEAYEKAGLKDMVAVQANKIRELEATMQPTPKPPVAPPSDAKNKP